MRAFANARFYRTLRQGLQRRGAPPTRAAIIHPLANPLMQPQYNPKTIEQKAQERVR